MKVYLDVCCLNRLFDNQEQARIALEAAAVIKVLDLIDSLVLSDCSSEMAKVEIERMPDADRRRGVLALLPPDERIMPLSQPLLDSADEFVALGFQLADAVHLAAAKRLAADVLLTVDDKFLRRAKRYAGRLGCRVLNPMTFVEELGDAIDG
ncbi:MAG TPA: PIN domain-containing protein [Tepidisphaeraceae bacterium]|jgi:predicted nucleic acid-binding protein|nr:PIN domain-containing protein [Tepidisphaeraceae bacterium]